MGAVLSGSYGSTSSDSKSSGTSTPTYSGGQSDLQSSLAALFKTLLPSQATGGISPNVAAVTTSSADTINKSYSSMGDRMSKFLAQRGFGQSGESGKVALQTELGRQGALAANASNGAGLQLQQNNPLLSDALMYAFTNPGQSSSTVGSGSSSGFSIGGGVGGGK